MHLLHRRSEHAVYRAVQFCGAALAAGLLVLAIAGLPDVIRTVQIHRM